MSVTGPVAKDFSQEELARERAQRLRDMLDRWALEDVSAEPEWDVADVAPVSLRRPEGTESARDR